MIPLPNPFETMGSIAGRIVVEGWTAAMLAVWNSGLWVLRVILGWVDSLLTPDLSENGPGHALYPVTFWLAAALLLILGLVQLAIAAAKRDGRELARAGIGLMQFALVWAAWIGYTVMIVAAASGLTRALMESLLNVSTWREWQPWEPIKAQDITDATTATVLGVLGVLVWIAAIAHVVMMLTRAAALLVIVATTPISAAGLATETTRVWFWKSLRWFHAAAFAPPVTVMVTGIGMQFATGVAAGQASGPLASIATAIPAVILICIAAFAPLALFKLLAFVDPGTASGAAARAGLAASGGLQGLLSGKPGATGDSTASQSGDSGQSAGESSADVATTNRMTSATTGGLGALGPVGAFAAAGIGLMAKAGTAGAALTADATNQMGVGHNSYYPDQQGSGGDAERANHKARDDNQQGSTTPPPRTPTDGAGPTGGSGAGTGAAPAGETAAGGSTAAEVAVVAV
ncbi:MAG: type IV secretion system protein [Actinobacteria bacterium]|jgi:hypothetical protein|nr:type IV secretion system protein [Actinomycetota bacterium]